mgnify:CR=1 FL=1
MEKPVVFKSQNQQIIGIIHIPDNLKEGEKAPSIVMFHGFTGNKSEAHRLFVKVARRLCDAGFVVLRFDFRGSGDSEGEFEDMTVPGEVDDAEEAINFLLKQPYVDEKRIGVIGLSLGGRVASIIASKDERLRFVVLYSPALGPLREFILSSIGEEGLRRLESSGEVEVSSGWYVKRGFFETVDYIIPLNIMDRIKVPILIIHSDHDEVIPVDISRKGYEIVKCLNDKNEFYIVKGGDHTFSNKEHTEEVIEKTLSWLRSLQLK